MALRLGGPLVILVGLTFMAIGLLSFFSAFGTFEPPRYFWCCFVGMPFLFVGLVMTMYGYAGAVFRYWASETAPVAKDTFNYLAEGTQPGVRTTSRAITEGIREGLAKPHQEPPPEQTPQS